MLVVDDSALARTLLTRGLSQDPEIEVVGAARDPYEARDLIVHRAPDVVTLDVEMPRMDGIEFLRRLIPQYPIPVVMVSSLTQHGRELSLQALEAGAVDIVPKPTRNLSSALDGWMAGLREKVKLVACARVVPRPRSPRAATPAPAATAALAETTDRVLALGASTGGVEALRHVLTQLPPDAPGTVVVQHMPPGFTATFASRLDEACRIAVSEARDGDRVLTGRALIAPGDRHMEVFRSGGEYRVRLHEGEKVNGHRPSASVLMHSVANHVGKNAIGAILTGMGRDGADGLLAMRRTGARTAAQDAASSVVWGMPGAAWELGAAESLVSLEAMPSHLLTLASRRRAA